jgi:hypothetical protein
MQSEHIKEMLVKDRADEGEGVSGNRAQKDNARKEPSIRRLRRKKSEYCHY